MVMNFMDFNCLINKLKVQQNGLEKHETDFVKYIKSNYDLSIEDEFYRQKNLREQELNKLKCNVQHNIQSLKNIKFLISPDNLDALDLSVIQNSVVELEMNIQDLKIKVYSELDNFTKTENNLTNELNMLEMKLFDSKNIDSSNKSSVYSSKNRVDDRNTYQEVQDFRVFLQKSGGHEGGWSEDDHLIFTKIYRKHENSNKVISLVRKLLPDIPEKEIMAHYEWYKHYLDLRLKQKEAIEKWKQTKIHEEKKDEELEPKLINQKKAPPKTMNEVEIALKNKLAQWKLGKEQLRQKVEECKQLNKTREKQRASFKRMKQKELKREIEKWKNIKEVKERADRLEKEIISLRDRERRISMANKLIREYQSQDSFYIQRRLSMTRNSVTAPASLQQIQLPKNHETNRDPERVFKATRTWMLKTKPDDNDVKPENIFGGYVSVKGIQKLGVPEWRR